jgi:hypothetical protein
VPPRLAKVLVSAFAAVLAATIVPACSNMAEGERCDVRSDNGGNDDCQDGLRCTPAGDVRQPSDICCPPDRSKATTTVCAQAPSPGGNIPPSDAGADTTTADTSAPDTSTSDTGVADAEVDAFDAADSE